jgi:transposase
MSFRAVEDVHAVPLNFDRNLEGRLEKEKTSKGKLSATERTRRSKAYIGKSTSERELLKAQFDAEKKQQAETVERTSIYELNPTPIQQRLLERMMADARRTYNLVMADMLRRGLADYTRLCEVDLDGAFTTALESQYLTEEALSGDARNAYLLRTPKVPRQQAIRRAVDVFKTFKTKFETRLELRAKYPDALKFKDDIKFNPGFKSRKLDSDSLEFERVNGKVVDETHFSMFPTITSLYHPLPGNAQSLYPRTRPVMGKRSRKDAILASIQLRGRFREPNPFERSFKIHYELGRWRLLITRATNVTSRPVATESLRMQCVAVDPGIRKFLTLYSPEGRTEIIGTNTTQVMNKALRRCDRTKLKLTKTQDRAAVYRRLRSSNARTRKYWRKKVALRRKAYHNAERKMKNIVKHLHYNAAHHLCRRYETILYPDFNAQEVAEGNLQSMVKRRLQALAFFKFKERLVQTASFYSGTRVLRGTEAYTSKTCGRCGVLNETLGGSVVFTCPACGLSADRDVHAARNIYLRFLKQ